ncbi:response regulator [Shewanella eurypsychrophilus]|uniref:histidine kinase n=1 Tax=Shewanella eurypsychrophilus TaxID=2593656 RepID=A0ABX6V5U2_9GAMM|nr:MULTISPECIES: response regulator [Shewanella]QFU22702.1 response regulator [Shewanella sp. YLB-09]QPG57991.1 response regulator [Shewanella eurypsychrophilus]
MDKINSKIVVLIKLLSMFVTVISGIIIMGWLARIDGLLRLAPSMTPMQFNTALCFLLSASGLLLIAYERGAYLSRLAIALGLIASVSLLQYVVDINLGVDELFVAYFINTEQVSHPGRMAPNTALNFIFSSLFLLLYKQVGVRFVEINRALACLVIGLSAIAIFGYIFGVPSVYGWKNVTAMALSTSINFLLIGTGMLLCLSSKRYNSTAYTLPLLILIIAVSAISWQTVLVSYKPTGFDSITPNIILYCCAGCCLVLIYFSYFKRSPSPSHFGQYVALVILCLGTISSLSLYSYLSNHQTVRLKESLHSNASSHVTSLQATIDILTVMLDNARVISYYNEVENEAIFNTMSGLFLKKYPSVTRIMYVPIISDQHQFEQQIKRRYDFEVGMSEVSDGRKIKAGIRALYTPILYQYPISHIDNDIGLDLYAQRQYREVFDGAFAANTLSHRIFDGQAVTSHAMIIAPLRHNIYQKSYQIDALTDIRGFIVLEYNLSQLIDNLIQQSLVARGLHMLIESEKGTTFAFFHQSRRSIDSNINPSLLSQTEKVVFPLNIADEQLSVSVWPSDSFIKQYDSVTPEVLSFLLLISSIIISFYQYRTTKREQKIEQMKAYLASVVDALPNPMLIVDKNMLFVGCNQQFASMFDIEKHQIKSKEFLAKIAAFPDYHRMRIEDEDCFNTGESKQSEVSILLASGEERIYSYLRNVVEIDNEKRLIGTLYDLTAEKAITEALNLALTNANEMFISAPDAMVIVSDDGVIVQINSAAESLFGYYPDELVGKKIEVLLPENIREAHVGLRRSFIDEKNSRPMGKGLLLMAVDHQGENIHVEVSLSPIKTSEGLHVVASVRDVSERSAFEKAIQDAKEEAEDANRTKSAFLANMSHEIRTPMNAIIGFTHLLLESALNIEQDKYAHKIKASANSLLGIINDILDVSKIEAGKLELEHIQFNLYIDVLENMSNIISLKADEKNLQLLFDFDTNLPANLIGDPLRLGQILLNLLNNAVKFTHHGAVTLSIKVVSQTAQNARLSFEVQDSGIGMSVAEIDKLFVPFTQADSSTTRTYGGTGLGLSICHKLVTLMGGTIGVNAKVSQGSNFWFQVDFNIAANNQGQQEHDLQVMPLNILIVDDDPASLMVIKSYIESFGFHAEIEHCARQALQRLKDHHFDLIICDWKMPEMDGIEFVRELQNQLELHAPTVIMVSAFERDRITTLSHDLTLSAIMTKPIAPSTLLGVITDVLGGHSAINATEIAIGQKYDFSGVRILLVEDNVINQELAEELLRQVQVNVTIANNGQEAIYLLAQNTFDLVLMDIQMPVLDGISATKQIRQDPHYEHLPIIAMTANALMGDRNASMSAGMNDHINKPIDVKALYKMISKWTGKSATANTSKAKQPKVVSRSNTELMKSLNMFGLQTESALARLNSDEVFYLSLLNKLQQRISEQLPSLKAIHKRRHLENMAAEVHTLKGLLATVGANELSGQCAVFEMKFNIQQYPVKELNEFFIQLEAFATSINDLMLISQADLSRKLSTSPIQALSSQQIIAAIVELERLLLSNDSDAMELVEKLIIADLKPKDKLEALLAHCERYDFEAAYELLLHSKAELMGEKNESSTE